jgi:hypothetical protein
MRQEKTPPRVDGASSLQGLKTRDYPAHAATLTAITFERKQAFWGESLFAIACCFLATAREEESQYSRTALRFNFGGLTCVSYLLAQSSFRLQSEWEVVSGTTNRRSKRNH